MNVSVCEFRHGGSGQVGGVVGISLGSSSIVPYVVRPRSTHVSLGFKNSISVDHVTQDC